MVHPDLGYGVPLGRGGVCSPTFVVLVLRCDFVRLVVGALVPFALILNVGSSCLLLLWFVVVAAVLLLGTTGFSRHVLTVSILVFLCGGMMTDPHYRNSGSAHNTFVHFVQLSVYLP